MFSVLRSALVLAPLVFAAATLSPTLAQAASGQMESIADRLVDSSSTYAGFKEAASVSAVSPASSVVATGDLVVTYNSMRSPATLTAVVRKPRGSGTFQIPVMPPGSDAFTFLNDQLETAVAQKAGLIKFPQAQLYQLGSPLQLAGLTDAIVDFNGSTLEMTSKILAINLSASRRVVLRNGTIRGTGQLATIAEVSLDNTGRPRFTVLPEFRSVLEASTGGAPGLETVGSAEKAGDGSWRLRIPGYFELFTNRGGTTNNFRYASGVFEPASPLSLPAGASFQPGQRVWLLHENNTAHGILLDNEEALEDITLEDLTLVNIPGMAIAGELKRGLHINRLNIARKSSSTAVFATSSDGVHINANGGDIVIESSTFGPNADDKINIKGNYWKVTVVDRATNTVEVQPVDRKTSVRRWGFAGQRLIMVDGSYGVIGTAMLTADTIRVDSDVHTLQLQSIPSNLVVGTILANVDNGSGRVVIRNNTFADTRAQAVLVQTSHVVVANNSFEGIAGPAIKLNMGLREWFEAVNTDNVLITGNTFRRCSQRIGKSNELIYFHQVDSQNQPIRIIGNVRIVRNLVIADDAGVLSRMMLELPAARSPGLRLTG